MSSSDQLRLRPATLDDSDRILAWRNDPEAITMSASQHSVTQIEHDAWFIKALADGTTRLYVAEVDAQPVGMGRINQDHGVAVLSYSVDRDYRGHGYAGQIVADLCVEAYKMGYTCIQAVVRHANTASLKALLRNEFQLSEHELLRLERRR